MIDEMNIEIANTGHITNSYLYYTENNEAVLIDAPDSPSIISSEIEKNHLKLKYVLLTHAHIDHILALDDILKKYNVKAIVNENEKDMLDGKVDNCSSIFNLKQKKYNLDNFIFLSDGDSISIENDEIIMVSTPGHTKGSVCYYVKGKDIIFTGDTLFYNSFGRFDLDSGSFKDMYSSIERIYNNYMNCKMYPGHGKSCIKIRDTDNLLETLKIYKEINDESF